MLPPRGGGSIASFLFPATLLIHFHLLGQAAAAAAENSVSLQKGPAITRADMSNRKGHVVTKRGERICGAFNFVVK